MSLHYDSDEPPPPPPSEGQRPLNRYHPSSGRSRSRSRSRDRVRRRGELTDDEEYYAARLCEEAADRARRRDDRRHQRSHRRRRRNRSRSSDESVSESNSDSSYGHSNSSSERGRRYSNDHRHRDRPTRRRNSDGGADDEEEGEYVGEGDSDGGNRRGRGRRRGRHDEDDRYRRDDGIKWGGPASDHVLLCPLPLDMTDFELDDALRELRFYGASIVRVLRDRRTGVSRQAGIVQFRSLGDARELVRYGSHGLTYRDCTLHARFPATNADDWACSGCKYVNMKLRFLCSRCGHPADIELGSVFPKEDGIVVQSSCGSNDVSDTTTQLLLVRGLPVHATAEMVYDMFGQLADALDRPSQRPIQARLISSKATHASLGYAFVDFASAEVAKAVLATLSNRSFFPSGFYVADQSCQVSFGAPESFATAYAPTRHTVVLPDATRILVYRGNPVAYAVGWPVPQVSAAAAPHEPSSLSTEVGRIKADGTDDDDPLAAFLADVHTPDASSPVPPPPETTAPPPAAAAEHLDFFRVDTIPAYQAVVIPEWETFVDPETRTCYLCRLMFRSAPALIRHAVDSEQHRSKLASDDAPLAQQLAMHLRYAYTSVRRPRQQPATLESGIGGRLLAKMGWKLGAGLGRDGDGITAAIEASDDYASGVGVGGVIKPAASSSSDAAATARAPWISNHTLAMMRRRYNEHDDS